MIFLVFISLFCYINFPLIAINPHLLIIAIITFEIPTIAHLYTNFFYFFIFLLLNDHCTLGLIPQILVSIISHFIF